MECFIFRDTIKHACQYNSLTSLRLVSAINLFELSLGVDVHIADLTMESFVLEAS